MKVLLSYALACVIAFGAPGALAQSAAEPAAALPEASPPVRSDDGGYERVTSQKPDQALYKGVVGNLLEAVPMDAEKRVELQRANAVVGGPFSARSVALLLGIVNPIVMIGGLVWGIYAASQIESPKTAKAAAETETARADLSVDTSAD